ncbi:hypothetical protein RJ639_037630 [Escallonia herrerae]|uniref:KIB1-4 beta-propeller domain-containing protein n=1 Tax=Escallonia herrerae TaxID=1293975 RepID=A0AA88WMQ8_9ASTE|nr:hypothetical protein RJ639_037630 [Escallonia herrerae]
MLDRRHSKEERSPQEVSKYAIERLVMSSSPENNKSCNIMIIQVFGDRGLAFCRLGDTAWTALDGALKQYKQLVYSSKDKLFYVVSYRLEFEAWDLNDPCAPKRHTISDLMADSSSPPLHYESEAERLLMEESTMSRIYLAVEPSSSQLFNIRRLFAYVDEDGLLYKDCESDTLPLRTLAFQVYKLSFGEIDVTEYLKCLDHRSLVIGLNDGFILSAHDFPQLSPNSIYFTDDLCATDHLGRGQDMGVYNLDRSITRFYPFNLKKSCPQRFGSLLIQRAVPLIGVMIPQLGMLLVFGLSVGLFQVYDNVIHVVSQHTVDDFNLPKMKQI